jgi:deazaflavin-dependent oxidoreductase (nitroreductase family)
VAIDKKTPRGTHGAGNGFAMWLAKVLRRRMIRVHKRSGDTFQGMTLLYLTTVGAKSGIEREIPLAYFQDPDDVNAWLIVASLGGAANNPAWYHNIAANPDRVRIQVNGQGHRVVAEQLEGERRARAWRQITADQQRYADYQEKTDRQIPVLRLTPA